MTPLGFDVDDFLKLFRVFSVTLCTLFFSQPLSTPAPSSYVLTTSMCYFPGSNHDLTTYMWVTSIHCSLLMLRYTYISSSLLNTPTQMSPLGTSPHTQYVQNWTHHISSSWICSSTSSSHWLTSSVSFLMLEAWESTIIPSSPLLSTFRQSLP